MVSTSVSHKKAETCGVQIAMLVMFVCCVYLQMEKLELKLASELPSTAKVVACRFPFPTWIPESTAGEGIDTVWVYDAKTFKSHL